MTRPIPRMDPRCPDFLSWLCEEQERQRNAWESSISALKDAYTAARDRGDTREEGRIYRLLRKATNDALARSVESQKRTKREGGSR